MEIDIYQGEDPDARKNIPVGNFRVKGLKPTEKPNIVLCKMSLDIDGILKVTAIEKETGKSKQITIDKALQQKSDEEIAATRKHLQELYDTRPTEPDGLFSDSDHRHTEDGAHEVIAFPINAKHEAQRALSPEPPAETENTVSEIRPSRIQALHDAEKLLSRSRRLVGQMHDEDKEEAINFHEQIESAIASQNAEMLNESCEGLKELLFFLEGK